MPWKVKANGASWCSVCGSKGRVRCPVDHKNDPDNTADEIGPLFVCPTCEWVRGVGQSSSGVPCPECDEFCRDDTFLGDESLKCDHCRKRGAKEQLIPDDLLGYGRPGPRWFTHDECLPTVIERRTAQLADARRHAAYEQAGGPVSSCDVCGQPDEVELTADGRLICERCGGNLVVPVPRRWGHDVDPAPELAQSPAGWYDDPEYDGYLRWWSGDEWAGHPTLPEYCEA